MALYIRKQQLVQCNSYVFYVLLWFSRYQNKKGRQTGTSTCDLKFLFLQEFWEDLFNNASKWGMFLYEQVSEIWPKLTRYRNYDNHSISFQNVESTVFYIELSLSMIYMYCKTTFIRDLPVIWLVATIIVKSNERDIDGQVDGEKYSQW